MLDMQGKLAWKLVAPMDATMIQKAKSAVLGNTQKAGAAAAMQSTTMRNEEIWGCWA